MSASNEANFARIGAFICLGVALIVYALLRLGGVGMDTTELLAETYFPYDASGLSVGSAVTFRGVKIGSVKRVSFVRFQYPDANEHDGNMIWVEISFDLSFLPDDRRNVDHEEFFRNVIRNGLHATLASRGITGLTNVDLDFPKSKIVDAPVSWRPRSPCIPPAPSILQSAADSARRILSEIDQMNLAAFWSNVVETTGNANRVLENVNVFLESQQGNFADVVGNVRDATSAVRDAADTLRDNPSRLVWPTRREPLEETK